MELEGNQRDDIFIDLITPKRPEHDRDQSRLLLSF